MILVLEGMGGIGKFLNGKRVCHDTSGCIHCCLLGQCKIGKNLKIGIAEIAVRVGLDKVLDEGHHPAKDESNIAAAIKAVYE